MSFYPSRKEVSYDAYEHSGNEQDPGVAAPAEAGVEAKAAYHFFTYRLTNFA